jgi:hypothetical protein
LGHVGRVSHARRPGEAAERGRRNLLKSGGFAPDRKLQLQSAKVRIDRNRVPQCLPPPCVALRGLRVSPGITSLQHDARLAQHRDDPSLMPTRCTKLISSRFPPPARPRYSSGAASGEAMSRAPGFTRTAWPAPTTGEGFVQGLAHGPMVERRRAGLRTAAARDAASPHPAFRSESSAACRRGSDARGCCRQSGCGGGLSASPVTSFGCRRRRSVRSS